MKIAELCLLLVFSPSAYAAETKPYPAAAVPIGIHELGRNCRGVLQGLLKAAAASEDDLPIELRSMSAATEPGKYADHSSIIYKATGVSEGNPWAATLRASFDACAIRKFIYTTTD